MSTVYANISQFLDAKYPDFGDLFELLDYKIIVGHKGLTLLLPNEDLLKDFKGLVKEDKKILEKYSHEVDYLKKEYHVKESEVGHSLARWFLQALILTWYYPTGESFKETKVVNKLSRTYSFKSGHGDKAELSIGSITRNKDFVQLENVGPYKNALVAVWNLDGKPQIDTPEWKMEEKKGGGLDPNVSKGIIGCHVWYKVQQGKSCGKDMELVYIVSLLNYLKKHMPNLYKEALSVISYDPLVSLYLLLQPGHSESLIPHEVLKAWCNETFFNIEVDSKEKYMEICKEAGNEDHELTSDIKSKLGSTDYSVDSVLRIYAQLQPKHFPIYKGPEHKINHDVLRYHYSQSPIDYKRMCDRMVNIDSKLGQHSLNPASISVDKEDLSSFVNSPYFVFHLRVDQDQSRLASLTSPTFNITKESMADLHAKLGM